MKPLINGSIVRALQRIKKEPETVDLLVDAEYRDELLKLLGSSVQAATEESFDLDNEFKFQYNMIRQAIRNMGNIQSEEDLKILKEAKYYLQFIMKQEEKLASFKAVANFKEAVLDALDEADPLLRDRVLKAINEKLVS